MKPLDPVLLPSGKIEKPAGPRAKWWGAHVVEGNPPQTRFIFNWGRVVLVLGLVCLTGYLALATALWSYYAVYRKIPGVNWIDVAVLPRFSRVQSAIGASYYSDAVNLWEKKDYVRAIFNGRAAVQKAPHNLDARLFLADCWLQVGRFDEAVRTLRDGIEFDAANPRLQKALMETCIAGARYKELLTVLREELPAKGIRLLETGDRIYQRAELRAVLETTGASDAQKVLISHPGLAEMPAAAPLIAWIDWELDQPEAAFTHLSSARKAEPLDPGIEDAYIDTALRMKKADEARNAANQFLAASPHLLAAQLRFLEAHGSRKGGDRPQWMRECALFLAQYEHDTPALERLGSLAASQGWTDLAFLLYQNSLQENLTGFPFAIYYTGSLVKAGDFGSADEVWRELSSHNSAQLASSSHMAAMVSWGIGRESEALQIIEQLRQETNGDAHRRRKYEQLFRAFGFPKMADELMAPSTPET